MNAKKQLEQLKTKYIINPSSYEDILNNTINDCIDSLISDCNLNVFCYVKGSQAVGMKLYNDLLSSEKIKKAIHIVNESML